MPRPIRADRHITDRPITDRQRTGHRAGVPDGLDPDSLLALLRADRGSLVVGFAADERSKQLTVLPELLPVDDRSGSAGIFGRRAPENWFAVGAVLAGRARSLDTSQIVSPDAIARVIVTSAGQVVSDLHLEGSLVEDPTVTVSSPGMPEGIMIDTLHRMLELASPGDAPMLASFVVTIWLHEILEYSRTYGVLDWADAVLLHPDDLGGSTVGPSIETVVEATVRAAGELDWHRMRLRASRSEFRAPDLSPFEAEWMDDTMFARWMVGSLAPADQMLKTLREQGSRHVAHRVGKVLDAITRRVPDADDFSVERRM